MDPAPVAAGNKSVGEILRGKVVRDGVSLNTTLREFCGVYGVQAEDFPADGHIHAFTDKSMWQLLSLSPSAREADSMFGSSNPSYPALRDIHDSVAVLYRSGINTLQDWCTQPIPRSITEITRNTLDIAAFSAGLTRYTTADNATVPSAGVRTSTEPLQSVDIDALRYDAIVSATSECYCVSWSGDEGDRLAGGEKDPKAYEVASKLEVRRGQAFNMQSEWVGDQALRVLTIGADYGRIGWPVDTTRGIRTKHLFVRRESDMAFHRVFEHVGAEEGGESFLRWKTDHDSFIIMGTPGIGKTYLSCYFLWWLLRREVEFPTEDGFITVTAIIYSAYDDVIVYDKTRRTAHRYPYSEYETAYKHFKTLLPRDRMGIPLEQAGLELFNCCYGRNAPPKPCPVLVFTSPDANVYKDIENRRNSMKLVVNPWSVDELCAWSHCFHEGTPNWATVKRWMYRAGPIPRLLAGPIIYSRRADAIANYCKTYKTLEGFFQYAREDVGCGVPIMMMLRVGRYGRAHGDRWKREPSSSYVKARIKDKISKLGTLDRLRWCRRILEDPNAYGSVCEPIALDLCEKHLPTMLSQSTAIMGPLTTVASHISQRKLWRERDLVPTSRLRKNVLYTPPDRSFPVIDGFVYLSSIGPHGTFVGIRVGDQGRDPLDVFALERFKKSFDEWGIPEKAQRILLSVASSDCAAMETPMEVRDFNGLDAGHVAMGAFWETFAQRQYIVEETLKGSVEQAIREKEGAK